MKNKNGFTLIELLSIIIIVGILSLIAIPAITKYLIDSKNTAYSSFENAMINAAKNRVIDCLSDNNMCELPDGSNTQKMSLKLLVSEGYIDNMKDPDSDEMCDLNSYVSLKSKGKNSYNYEPCLHCGVYKTDSNICNKVEGDSDSPICGEIVGASTRWTNQNRTITVECSDKTSGCEQAKFSRTFKSTTPNGQGEITIIDKSGETTACKVNAYVDKTLPTCEIKAYGDYYEHVGWYSKSATAKIENQKDSDSGLLTYGIGTSIKNRNYNKNTELVVKKGITSVIGYVKDIAGNEGLCSREIRVGQEVPEFDLYYGYQLYPTDKGFSTFTMNVDGNRFTTTSTIADIRFNDTSRYKNIAKVIVKLDEPIETTTEGTLSVSGGARVTGLMQQGSKEIVFLIPKNKQVSSASTITIDLGKIDGATYVINSIEALTKDGSAWVDNDINVYVEPYNQGLRTMEVSYDNGTTWTTDYIKKYTDFTETIIKTRNSLLIESAPLSIKVPIDKQKPVAKVEATRIDNNNTVSSNSVANVGLNFKVRSTSTGGSVEKYYYCVSNDNSCDPDIEVEKNQLITEYNDIKTAYYFRYKVVKETGSTSDVGSFRAVFDLVKPTCIFTNLETYLSEDTVAKIICSDSNGIQERRLDKTAFSFSTNDIYFKTINCTTDQSGKTLTCDITLKGKKEGTTTITLKGNRLTDRAGNKNDMIVANIGTYNAIPISLTSDEGTVAKIYTDSSDKFYLDPAKTKEMTQTENKAPFAVRIGYVFDGYYTENNGNGVKFIDENGFITEEADRSIIESNRKLYAKFNNSKRLYDYMARANGVLTKTYDGDHQDSMDPSKSDKPIFYWYGTSNSLATSILNVNNVVFADFCWQMIRTTDTGGVRLLYNGVAIKQENNGTIKYKCGSGSGPTATDNIEYNKNISNIEGIYFGSKFNIRSGSTIEYSLSNYISAGNLSDMTDDQRNELLNSLVSTYKYTCFSKNSSSRCTKLGKITSVDDNKLYYIVIEPTPYYDSISVAQAFNNSKAVIGYKYNPDYQFLTSTLFNQATSLNMFTRLSSTQMKKYYYGDSYSWDGSNYTLNNPYTITSSEVSSAVGKYTLGGTTPNEKYDTAYYGAWAYNNYIYLQELKNNIPPNNYNYYIYYGDSYTYNSDGTFTINNPNRVSKYDWINYYTDLKNKYVCINSTSNTCSDLKYIKSVTETTIQYYSPIIFASDYTYSNGKYYLNNDRIVFGNSDSLSNTSGMNTHHYTCLGLETECESLAYVFYANSTSVQYVYVKPGKIISNNLSDPNNLLYYLLYENNTEDSSIKTIVENWYRDNLYNNYDRYIDDTIYCNDRTLIGYGSFKPNGGSVSSSIRFKGYNYNISLGCSRVGDQYSVSNSSAPLNYKVGLMTYSELYLLNHENIRKTTSAYLLMTPASLSSIGILHNDGSLQSITSNITIPTAKLFSVRPVISLIAEMEYSSGSGSLNDPFIVKLN